MSAAGGPRFLSELALLAPPPQDVEQLSLQFWEHFAAQKGFAPPLDFRALIDLYGFGGFGYQAEGPSLMLLPPDSVEPEWLLSTNIAFRERFPRQAVDWPMWPEPGGFLPWGTTVDGDQVGWLTEGEAAQWGTGVYAHDAPSQRFSFGCVEFIYRWFTRTLGIEQSAESRPGNPAQTQLRFYPAEHFSGDIRTTLRSEVTVHFSGLGLGVENRLPVPDESVNDPRLSSEERWALLDQFWDALETAQAAPNAVVEQWVKSLPDHGLEVLSVGKIRRSDQEPLHWEIGLLLSSANESAAKELIVDLARRLELAVSECRDAKYALMWNDVVARTHGGTG